MPPGSRRPGPTPWSSTSTTCRRGPGCPAARSRGTTWTWSGRSAGRIGIPLAVKLSPYFSSLANLAGQLVEAGANGLVLFNRFYQPDLDIEAMEVLPALELSSSAELRLPLRWIAILHRRWGISLAASTGVHTAEDVVKVLLAGADVAMMTSALLHNGPDHLRPVELGLRDWMDRHRYETVDQLRGQLSQRSVPDPAAFERANYIKTLASRTAPRR